MFHKQRPVYFNGFSKESNIYFSGDIDNIDSIEKISNIAVAPLVREDGSTNGIIHLFNCKQPITNSTKTKLEALSRFFGSMISNLEAKKVRITQMVAVMMDKKGYAPVIKTMDEEQLDNLVFLDSMKKPFDTMDTAMNPAKLPHTELMRELE